jgi:3D (Asp-Asp-Asp) domain-containing protein
MNYYKVGPTRGIKISTIFIISVFLIGLGTSVFALKTHKTFSKGEISLSPESQEMSMIEGNSLLPIADPQLPMRASRAIPMIITAYSSTISQTYGDPFITASGDRVRDGIVANNLLPFGTKIRIPEIYGDKIFIVKDRMNSRKGSYHLDIWFSEYWQAKSFGVRSANIEILEN